MFLKEWTNKWKMNEQVTQSVKEMYIIILIKLPYFYKENLFFFCALPLFQTLVFMTFCRLEILWHWLTY